MQKNAVAVGATYRFAFRATDSEKRHSTDFARVTGPAAQTEVRNASGRGRRMVWTFPCELVRETRQVFSDPLPVGHKIDLEARNLFEQVDDPDAWFAERDAARLKRDAADKARRDAHAAEEAEAAELIASLGLDRKARFVRGSHSGANVTVPYDEFKAIVKRLEAAERAIASEPVEFEPEQGEPDWVPAS